MTPRRTTPAVLALIAYLGSIVAANWLITRYGFVPVGFGLMAPAGTYAAGVAFVARDSLQDAYGRAAVLGALVAGVAISAWVSTPALAVASAVAFGASELADMAVYTPLRARGYIRAAVASNVVGAAVDSVLFLALAGFPVVAATVGGQYVGKLWITLATVTAVAAYRAARHRARNRQVDRLLHR